MQGIFWAAVNIIRSQVISAIFNITTDLKTDFFILPKTEKKSVDLARISND